MAFKPSQENLLRIAALWDAGNTLEEIAAQVQCSERTARRWVQKFEIGEADLFQDQRCFNMRQICTTAAEDEAIIQQIRANPFQPANKIPETLGLNISGRVAQRRLRAAGIKCRKAAKKLLLTPRHRTQRINFAIDKDGRYRVWRTDNTRYEPNNILPSTSSGHVTAAFWAWMSADGPGDLVEVGRNFMLSST
ncbi:uncharacterized protein LOC120358335 [Solenopsis invicta]|uniref:uncharacterized protein LOC120358335 n=1 Tax=Solenopsis invicta TaxID=13686 RepID=UPI00193E471D|nr:uncharacterized protein LOC120358335 [Solenopsis invicta]